MDPTQIAGTNLDELAARAESLNAPDAVGLGAREEKRGRGRPKGSKTRSPQSAMSPATPLVPTMDPEEESRRELARIRAARIRAGLPMKAAEKYYSIFRDYTGKAFKLTDDQLEDLVQRQRDAQTAISSMEDGFVKGLLELGVGSEDREDGPVMAMIVLVAAQADMLTTAIKEADRQLADSRKS